MAKTCRIQHWGLVDYPEAMNRQQQLAKEVADGKDDVLVLCEHPKVITLGQRSHEENLFLSRQELLKQGFVVCGANRGGDVTLHAPGQLILYPIIDLKRQGSDLKAYLRGLEQVAVDLLGDFGILAQGDDERRGVWVGKDKIASIGIGVRRWITYHGMSVNVSTDLKLFRVIRPCGLDVQMTSMERILGFSPSMAEVMTKIKRRFEKVFEYKGSDV
jgi:lipoate-protein ligase B